MALLFLVVLAYDLAYECQIQIFALRLTFSYYQPSENYLLAKRILSDGGRAVESDFIYCYC